MRDGAPVRGRISRAGAFVIVMLLIGAALLSYVGYQYYVSSKARPALTVQNGDNVYLNYTGQYSNGQIFDTSIYSVAKNNATYPKGPGFTWRGNSSTYTPLQISNVGTGQVVAGMDSGIVGMHVNQTKFLVIPASQGYGPLNMSLLTYMPIFQHLTMVHTVNRTQFISSTGQQPYSGMTFRDPFWHWTDTIMSTQNSTVVYQYSPSAGMVIYPYSFNSSTEPGYGAWPVTVMDINSSANGGLGQITLRNDVSQQMVKNLGGQDQNGSKFVLWSINSNGTLTLNYNRPVTGRTLDFTVTITYISNPTTGKSVGKAGYVVYAPVSQREL